MKESARHEGPVQILWTGGWDSTFRLLQVLLLEWRSVQPIYVVDRGPDGNGPGRKSFWKELEAMDAIINHLVPRLPPEVTLYPRKIYFRHDFKENRSLLDRYESLKKKVSIGSQYYWLAAGAESLGWEGLEICMPKHEMPSDLQDLIFHDLSAESPVLKDSWEAELFSYWAFPCINLEKRDMRRVAEKQGFLDILNMRWFCFLPHKGKACGVCRPCRIAIEDGVTEGVTFVSKPKMLLNRVRLWLTPRIKRVIGARVL